MTAPAPRPTPPGRVRTAYVEWLDERLSARDWQVALEVNRLRGGQRRAAGTAVLRRPARGTQPHRDALPSAGPAGAVAGPDSSRPTDRGQRGARLGRRSRSTWPAGGSWYDAG